MKDKIERKFVFFEKNGLKYSVNPEKFSKKVELCHELFLEKQQNGNSKIFKEEELIKLSNRN